MLSEPPAGQRMLRSQSIEADLVVVGGGLAGTCCAITAARQGVRVILVQDRPVLGGNASSEVRLWILGATSHGGNNNRWAREGGVVEEILVENVRRNRDGNPLMVDALLLEKVREESNITLLLNTAVFECSKAEDDPDRITGVRAFCSQNSTMFQLSAPLFVDASGDGILGFLAGAAFRMGAEAADEFGEKLAPSEEYGELLGHSMYFYTKELDHPVDFVPPSFALQDVTDIPRWRQFNADTQGCQLWWIEYGGRLDTVHDTEEIKWELWRVIYGVWNHIKNSGQFPEAANKTLEWVGTVPGKRESRRFEGDVMLTQSDIVEQRHFDDAVAFGGWAIDLHPADGVFSEKPGCNQYHSIGTYQIPYRSLYSRNIKNLFLGGRTMSASHVAFGSTRVMATTSHMGQAIGHAAAVCSRNGVLPREVSSGTHLAELQRDLLRSTQHIPAVPLDDGDDLVGNATLSTSSSFKLDELPASDDWLKVEDPQAMLLPLKAGAMPSVAIEARAAKSTEMRAELRVCSRPGSFTPDTTLEQMTVPVAAGDGAAVTLSFESQLPRDAHVFVCVFPADGLELRLSDRRVTGVMRVQCRPNKAVSAGAQTDMEHLGVDAFDFWCPERRPGGQNLAMRLDPPVAGFSKDELTTGVFRPCDRTNAWVADLDDDQPTLTLDWPEPQTIRRVDLHFDTDFDNPLESVLLGHHDSISPFVVRQFRLIGIDADGNEHTLGEADDNSASHVILLPDVAVDLRQLWLELTNPSADVPAALFAIRCYADPNAGPIRRHPGRAD